ncbi:MAG: DUF1028 domain-containing protein [Chloroflexi bacterium]|nr:MAG: DUF1028 domain-containing protein [Chloroflexota bacterium]
MAAKLKRFPFAHTFSIVARDPSTGEIGVAVQSHWFSVGSVVAWGEPGVGVVATQSMVEKSYGPQGLELMHIGITAPAALPALLQADDNREVRQVAMVDSQGRVAVHTGARCIECAGHIQGDGFSVQANMMLKDTVWPAMAEAYSGAAGSLAERMLAALEAAQAAGGDIRGQQSASILVVSGTASAKPWEGILVDLRVEDHPQPVSELKRLLEIHRAYEWMNQGDAFLAEDQVEQALNAYRSAAELAPDMDELPFWHALTLADLNRMDEAAPIFKSVFQVNPNWAELVKRLPAAGLLRDDPELLQRILALRE